jgi:hypothetical protein
MTAMKKLNFAVISLVILGGCSGTSLHPATIGDAQKLSEGENLIVKGNVTNVFQLFGLCYYEISDPNNKASIKVLCNQSSPDMGKKVKVKITPADVIKICTWRVRIYKQIE